MPSVEEIASLIGASVDPRHAAARIDGVAALADAGGSHISFVGSDAYLKDLANTHAAAVIVCRRVKLNGEVRPALLIVDDADLALAKVLSLFAPAVQEVPPGVDRDARVDSSATIGENCRIAPFVCIGARSRMGRNCTIHSGVHIGDDVIIGDDCTLWPNVVIRERITIGNRVVIHAGAVIGSDGFGYRWDGSQHSKIPQIGTVVIEDDVEIGSCACIDRAKFSVTRIGRGTKIDNLVQIAHNCILGPHCVLAGQAGLAGSVTLGAGVVLGGQTAVSDHITIVDNVMAAGRSAIVGEVDKKGIISGMPALPHRQSLREQGAMRRLPELLNQVKKLEEEVAELKQQVGNKSEIRNSKSETNPKSE